MAKVSKTSKTISRHSDDGRIMTHGSERSSVHGVSKETIAVIRDTAKRLKPALERLAKK